jgi:hypothetical protein
MSEPAIRVEVRRSGGFAGLTRHAVADTRELPAQAAGRIRELVGGIDFEELAGYRPSGPDRFCYDVTVDVGEQSHRLSVGEASAPAELRSLLDFVIRGSRDG